MSNKNQTKSNLDNEIANNYINILKSIRHCFIALVVFIILTLALLFLMFILVYVLVCIDQYNNLNYFIIAITSICIVALIVACIIIYKFMNCSHYICKKNTIDNLIVNKYLEDLYSKDRK